MARKRKIFRRSHHHKRTRKTAAHPALNVRQQLKNELLTLLYQTGESFKAKEITQQLAHIRFSRKELNTILTELIEDNTIRKRSKNSFSLTKHHNLITGTIEANPKGFGFLTNISGKSLKPSYPPFTRDAFISAVRMNTGRHGDQVLARIIKVRKDGRPEAQIIKVIDRKSDRIAGFLSKDHSGLSVIPEDPRYPITIRITDGNDLGGKPGDCVITEILPGNIDQSNPSGHIIELLGSPDNVDVQMRLVIEKHRLPFQFSKKTIKESLALSESIAGEAEKPHRADLRNICHVTIDGESAKDFDDAVAVIKTQSGYRLFVSIADVSHFVQQGSSLDKEAYERGTSIYFPGRVIPMLPEKLSNDLCSLIPEEDRLTFTAILDFDNKGNRTKKKFTRSIIRSRHRFTYTTVKKIIIDNDEDTCRKHDQFLTPLQHASELAKLLQSKREQRGSIHFFIPEPDIALKPDGTIESINRTERNFAHEIIEEFMLAANEAVAETFTERNLPTLYRIHERPNSEKVEEFISFAETLDLHLPDYNDSPQWYNKALDIVKGKPLEYVVNNLLLRTMQQARYATDNVGHFGLAATDYCHFTSPIRRYPDLVVHRNLTSLLASTADKGGDAEKERKADAANHLSARERVAVDAERDITDRLKVNFMKKHIGDSFEGIISGVNNFAFFVELLEQFVSGSVPLAKLTDDYYIFDPIHHRVVGELSHKIFQIGDIVRVTLVDVDSVRNRIHFIPESVDQ